MPSHAVSTLEEAQVKKRTGYLIIAVLLTVLDGAVVVCSGWPVWTAWSGGCVVQRAERLPCAPSGNANLDLTPVIR